MVGFGQDIPPRIQIHLLPPSQLPTHQAFFLLPGAIIASEPESDVLIPDAVINHE